jgi:hypothetical protein
MKCLEMVNSWGYAYANRIFIVAEGHDVFRLGVIAVGGKMIPSGSLSL